MDSVILVYCVPVLARIMLSNTHHDFKKFMISTNKHSEACSTGHVGYWFEYPRIHD